MATNAPARAVQPLALLKQTWQEFGRDNIPRLSAAFAYYTFTSFFPLLLVLISLIGFALYFNIAAAENARSYVIDTMSSTLPAARELLAQTIQDTEDNGWKLGLAGLITGLISASGIFAQLEAAFNIIFDVADRKRSLMDTIKARAQAVLIVIMIALLMIASLVFGTVLTTAQSVVTALPGGALLGFALNIGLSLLLTTLLFGALYKYLPDKVVTWRAALIGGAFASATWQVGRELLTWWLGRSGGVTAGTVVGSVLAFLGLVYYASLILMFGAQLTATYDEMANPEKVAAETSEDSALRGPGQPPVLESGEPATMSRRVGGLLHTGRYNLGSFAVGFLSAIGALVLGARLLVARLLDRG